MAGYSTTPLGKKLGIKAHSRVRIENAPDNFLDLLHPLPSGIKISTRLRSNLDIAILFTQSTAELTEQLDVAMRQILQNGMIWVCWPKKASGILTDVTEDKVREIALPPGLVDVKVCAIDQVWSGLKLVIRKSNRK
ncbi:MAG: DUF3052 family protein [Pseudomonadota bacterium]